MIGKMFLMNSEPFRWDEVRTRLYGLTHNALRYILNLNEVCGEDFPLRR